MKSNSLSRRNFLATSALAFPYVATRSWALSPNSTIRHVTFGANGMAFSDVNSISGVKNVEVVACAEIDPARQDRFARKVPKGKRYTDWRELLANTGLPAHRMRTPVCARVPTPPKLSLIHI